MKQSFAINHWIKPNGTMTNQEYALRDHETGSNRMEALWLDGPANGDMQSLGFSEDVDRQIVGMFAWVLRGPREARPDAQIVEAGGQQHTNKVQGP